MDTLNPEQRKAVQTINGRVLILAGAGSGKTRVLTVRMAHLIQHHKIPPTAILGLTFTNKAASEMRRRMGELISPTLAKQVTLSTFHSFCMHVLRSEIHHLGYTSKFTIYDEQDVERLVKLIVRDLLQHESELPPLGPTMRWISKARSSGLSPDEIRDTGSEWHDQFAKSLYQRLHASMRAYNAVDFDQLIYLTVELFQKFPEVLAKYQERYRYLMIDEYQDTNPIQYRLASFLAEKHQNLCVVGDDDQSIYGWRGADIKNILDFSDATIVKLEQNYRSTSIILNAANAVISHNKARRSKNLWSNQQDGNLIEVFHAPSDIEEAQAVAARIAKLKEKGVRWKDIAILYRSNALSRQFELALMKQPWKSEDKWMIGIPYQIFGGLEFYERKEIKDLLAYLRVICNPADQEALLRIINQPRRGIGDSSLDCLTAYNRSQKVLLWNVLQKVVEKESFLEAVGGKARQGLCQFVELIEQAKSRFQQQPLHEAMQWLIDKIDFKKAIVDEVKSDKMREFKWENVEELITAMEEFERVQGGGLEDFTAHLTLRESNQVFPKGNQPNEDKVNLLTFHSAKGLEFESCFLVGVEDHIIPHEKSLQETGIEEERRLMYVAITRAMKFLTISMSVERNRQGKKYPSRPSRFLFEIPKELLKPTKWSDI